MFYFKFQIPNNSDGSVVSYSPGWCGTRDKCAQNEKGILYHDEERWGIGQAEGDYVPDDVVVLSEKEVVELLKTQTKEVVAATSIADTVKAIEAALPEKVFAGDKLAHRWDAKPEPEGTSTDPGSVRMRHYTPTMATGIGFCGKCMKVRAFKGEVPEGLKAANVFLNGKCPVCETTVKAKVV